MRIGMKRLFKNIWLYIFISEILTQNLNPFKTLFSLCCFFHLLFLTISLDQIIIFISISFFFFFSIYLLFFNELIKTLYCFKIILDNLCIWIRKKKNGFLKWAFWENLNMKYPVESCFGMFLDNWAVYLGISVLKIIQNDYEKLWLPLNDLLG